MSIDEIKARYQKEEWWNKATNITFIANVNERPQLKALRDWIEQNAFGFGERSFYWMWKLIVDEMPQSFSILEIGVFRGQTLALVKLLANLANKECTCYGISPLDTTGGHWESDYLKDIHLLHKTFNLAPPAIIEGLSTDPKIIEYTKQFATFDIVYIDGGHDYEVVKSDMANYPQMASKYLVVDDCCNDIPMPFGYFTGIESVTKAVKEWEAGQVEWELMFNVIHNKLYRRATN